MHVLPVDGYIIDIVRGDLLIEVQTRNFSALKAKLLTLTAKCPVRLIRYMIGSFLQVMQR